MYSSSVQWLCIKMLLSFMCKIIFAMFTAAVPNNNHIVQTDIFQYLNKVELIVAADAQIFSMYNQGV